MVQITLLPTPDKQSGFHAQQSANLRGPLVISTADLKTDGSNTTPRAIDENVLELLKMIEGAGSPIFLDLEVEADAKRLDCFNNVLRKIERDGGGIKYGWCVWLQPRVLIEAEFHAVWESPSGELKDITPKPDGETQILFIPESKIVYQRQPIANIRVVLNNSSLGHKLVAMGERMDALRAKHNDGTGRSGIPLSEVLGIGPRDSRVPIRNSHKFGRSKYCPCSCEEKRKKRDGG